MNRARNKRTPPCIVERAKELRSSGEGFHMLYEEFLSAGEDWVSSTLVQFLQKKQQNKKRGLWKWGTRAASLPQ